MEYGYLSSSTCEEMTTIAQFKAVLEEAKKSCDGPSNSSLKLCPESCSNYLRILEEEFKCPICQVVYIETAELKCHHFFCNGCIESWRRRLEEDISLRLGNHFCPVCRGPRLETAPNCRIDAIIEQVMAIQPEAQQQERQAEKDRREQAKKDRAAPAVRTKEREQRYYQQMRMFYQHVGMENWPLDEFEAEWDSTEEHAYSVYVFNQFRQSIHSRITSRTYSSRIGGSERI